MNEIAEKILKQLCNLCMDEGDACFQLIGGTHCQKVLDTQQAILALISEREKPMKEALKLARPYVEASAKAMKHTIVTKPAEDLAKIDAVLPKENKTHIHKWDDNWCVNCGKHKSEVRE